jgi:probable HAF family extracellular repeat protein
MERRPRHQSEGLSGSISGIAYAINDFGQAVGVNYFPDDTVYATEWNGGRVIKLRGLPGSTLTAARGINDAGQVVGFSYLNGYPHAIEWSHGRVISLEELPGSLSSGAVSINDFGQAVGSSGKESVTPVSPVYPNRRRGR